MTVPEEDGFTFGATQDTDDVPDPELSSDDLDALEVFIASLDYPRPIGSNTVGEAAFGDVGCASCHTPSFETEAGTVHEHLPELSDLRSDVESAHAATSAPLPAVRPRMRSRHHRSRRASRRAPCAAARRPHRAGQDVDVDHLHGRRPPGGAGDAPRGILPIGEAAARREVDHVHRRAVGRHCRSTRRR